MKNTKFMYAGLAIALSAVLFVVADAQKGNGLGANALDGSWNVAVTSAQPGPPPFAEMMTFTAGGGIIESNNLFPPAAASPGHGSWRYEGDQNFSFTFIKFLFDPATGQFTGTLKVTGTITATGKNSWEGPATVETFDPNGVLIISGTAFGEATRIAAVQ